MCSKNRVVKYQYYTTNDVVNSENKISIFTTTADVVVVFPTKRKSIQSRLEVYEKKRNKNGAAANVQVGNWIIRIIRNQTIISHGDTNSFYLSLPSQGNVKIDCSALSFFEKLSLKRVLQNYVDTISQWIGWDWKVENSITEIRQNGQPRAVVKYVNKDTTQPTSDELQGRTSAVVADGFCRGAAALSACIVAAAASGATAIDGKTEELKESFQGYDDPQNLVQVDQGTKDFVQGAKVVTGALASTVYTGVGFTCQAVSFLGSVFGPSIKSGAARVLTATECVDNVYDARVRVEDFCNVAGGVLSGIGTLLKGVEESAKILAPSVTTFVGEAVGQRYGREAGELTEDSLETAGNVASIGYNATYFQKQLLVKGVPDARISERDSIQFQMDRMIESNRGRRHY